MSVRFVEFVTAGNTKVWINPANVCWVQRQAGTTDKTAVATADSDSPFFVVGTVEAVVAKLQGESGSPTVVDNGGGLCQFDIP